MGVVITIPQLHVNPELVGCSRLNNISGVEKDRWSSHIPLMTGKEKNISTRAVHLVRFSRVDSLLLHCLNSEGLKLLIEDLTQVHYDRLMDLLPQMGSEDLDQ